MFTPDSLAFIKENRFMNSKDWFTEHKEEYCTLVLEPLCQLCDLLAPTVTNIDPQLITDHRSAISRIYCDMRFSRDNMLYRDMLWISFRRDRKSFPAWPEFYFVMTTGDFFYGCGYYCARGEAMEALRKMIKRGDEAFFKAKDAYESQYDYIMDGPCFKRSRHSEYPAELRDWLDRKSIGFTYKPKTINELFAPDLAERMNTTFMKMKPLYELLIKAEIEAADILN
ncbi:MAG: DUF2461 domain-containing protein [Clostridia bacterium]|nr:DUF2461 domain-containing protein [Clostridia bacterium]